MSECAKVHLQQSRISKFSGRTPEPPLSVDGIRGIGRGKGKGLEKDEGKGRGRGKE